MADTQTQPAQKTTALVKREPIAIGMSGGAMSPRSLAELIEFSKLVAHSSMVPKQFQGNVGDVIVAVQMGAELGLSPMGALQNIAVINGRPSLWGDAALAVIVARPDCDDVVEEFDSKAMTATCTVKRRSRAPVVRSFGVDDAKAAGLWGKQGPWTQYPKRMLQMRARGFALRDSFPDALRGVSIGEEAQDIPAVAEWSDAPKPLDQGRHRFGFAPDAEEHIDETTGEVVEMKPAPAPEPAKEEAKPTEPADEAPSTSLAQIAEHLGQVQSHGELAAVKRYIDKMRDGAEKAEANKLHDAKLRALAKAKGEAAPAQQKGRLF